MNENKKSLRPYPTALLNPRSDPSFKALFTHDTAQSRSALADFLSALLGHTVAHVEITSNEPPVDMLGEMQMAFDVAVIFDNGERAAIEMQGFMQDYVWSNRAEVQAARLLNISAKKGSRWDAPTTYQISVLNFNLISTDKKPFRWYTMKDEEGKPLSGLLNVLFLELPKIKEKFGSPPETLSKLEKWGLFLSCADDPAAQDYLNTLLKTEAGLMDAKTSLYEISEDEHNWLIQNSLDTARRDYNEGLYNAEQRGIKAGEHNKALVTARLMRANNLPTADIAKYTGLTVEEISALSAE